MTAKYCIFTVYKNLNAFWAVLSSLLKQVLITSAHRIQLMWSTAFLNFNVWSRVQNPTSYTHDVNPRAYTVRTRMPSIWFDFTKRNICHGKVPKLLKGCVYMYFRKYRPSNDIKN